jgi:hypothetical protein
MAFWNLAVFNGDASPTLGTAQNTSEKNTSYLICVYQLIEAGLGG